jgi:hypothetical protein
VVVVTTSWWTGKFFWQSHVGGWAANHTVRDDPLILTDHATKGELW